MELARVAKPYELQDIITATSVQETVVAALAAAKTAIQNAGKVYPCPKCQTVGKYTLDINTGNPADSGTYVHCEVCDGDGFTDVQQVPIISGYKSSQ
jgi:hypothetical protein